TASRVAVEVFMKQHEITPMRIALQRLTVPVLRSPAVVPHEQPDEPAGELDRHFPQRQHLSRPAGMLDTEGVAVIPVELLQGLDDQVVEREPHRPAPIRVSAEQPTARLRRLVLDLAEVAPRNRELKGPRGVAA